MSWFRRRYRPYILHSNVVLYEPFVYGFCGVGHKDPAPKVRFCEDVWQRRCMVDVETVAVVRSVVLDRGMSDEGARTWIACVGRSGACNVMTKAERLLRKVTV